MNFFNQEILGVPSWFWIGMIMSDIVWVLINFKSPKNKLFDYFEIFLLNALMWSILLPIGICVLLSDKNNIANKISNNFIQYLNYEYKKRHFYTKSKSNNNGVNMHKQLIEGKEINTIKPPVTTNRPEFPKMNNTTKEQNSKPNCQCKNCKCCKNK